MVPIETTHQPSDEQKERKSSRARMAIRFASLYEDKKALVRCCEAPLRRGSGKVAPQAHVTIRHQARGQRRKSSLRDVRSSRDHRVVPLAREGRDCLCRGRTRWARQGEIGTGAHDEELSAVAGGVPPAAQPRRRIVRRSGSATCEGGYRTAPSGWHDRPRRHAREARAWPSKEEDRRD